MQKRASAIACDGAIKTFIFAAAVFAPAVFKGTRLFTDITACAAVVFVAVEPCTDSIAAHGTADTIGFACPIDARDVLIGARLAAGVITGPAIPRVVREIRAEVARSAASAK
jgi:hypothetical protein